MQELPETLRYYAKWNFISYFVLTTTLLGLGIGFIFREAFVGTAVGCLLGVLVMYIIDRRDAHRVRMLEKEWNNGVCPNCRRNWRFVKEKTTCEQKKYYKKHIFTCKCGEKIVLKKYIGNKLTRDLQEKHVVVKYNHVIVKPQETHK